jgi:hypothetical protein
LPQILEQIKKKPEKEEKKEPVVEEELTDEQIAALIA